MNTDTPDSDCMTRTDYLREAEARHGEVALRTKTGDLIQIWTPCYEILPSKWIAYSETHGVSSVARMETVQMVVGGPDTTVELVPWSETPFSQEVGVGD
jgi:hypothetical protein